MKYTIATLTALALTLVIGGCLLSGQTTFTQPVDVVGATNTTITRIPIDLNDEQEWVDHKDDIKTVDELSVVAIITNNLAVPAKARLYLSNDDGLTTVEEVETEATLVFESPVVPASDELKIHWPDGFKCVQNRSAIEKEIFGDGIFWLYVIAADTPFNVDVKGEIVITITAGE
jgi:hypothetical protein